MRISKYQKARKLSLEFFYRHAFTIGVCAFIASLIFSCTFTLQFADDWPRNIPVYEYLISNAVWSRFSLFLAGFALMGGQIITFVMYKKAKKTWVFGLYCGLTFLSICATFGSFATGLEGRRIAAAQADTGITSLINSRDNIQKMIDQQNTMIDGYMNLSNPKITRANEIKKDVKADILLLNKANNEIKEYSSSGSGATTGDVITRMFYRTATVIQTLSFGNMSDETRDTIAMLLECFSFLLTAILLDLVAAFCAALSVRVDEEDFNQVIMDESMEQQHESNFAYAREQNRLTHEERMTNVQALQNMPPPMTASASTTPQPSQAFVPPQSQPFVPPPPPAPQKMTASPPASQSYTSSNSAQAHAPAPEKIAPSRPVASSRSVAPMTAKKDTVLETMTLPDVPIITRVKEVKVKPAPKPEEKKTEENAAHEKKTAKPRLNRVKKTAKKSKKRWVLDHKTLGIYVERAYRIPGKDKANGHNAWLGRRGEKGISGYTGIPESMCERIHKILRKSKLVTVKITGRQQWTIPKFDKKEMLKKIKEINL